MMAGNLHKVCINSPVFTREDEERYHYVETELEGSSRHSQEEVALESLRNGAFDAPLSVGNDQYRQDTPKTDNNVHDSALRDSLEGDYIAANDVDKCGIVVADSSRYEDVTIAAKNQRAVAHRVENHHRPDVVPKHGDPNAQPRRFYLHDDAEEYEEAQLEKQHQRRKARLAHVPHLELSQSEDELNDGEVAYDLELDDGLSSHENRSKNNTNYDNPRRVSFKASPHNSNINQLRDSLEVAEYHSNTGEGGGNPYYENTLYADDLAVDKNQLQHNGNAPAFSHPFDNRNARNHPPPSLSHGQAQVPQQFLHSQSQGHTSHTHSDVRGRPEEGELATDFVEANRHNVNRKPQRTYGQIHSRKKDKQKVDLSPQSQPADPTPSLSAPGRAKEAQVLLVNEQKPSTASGQTEMSDVASAEQLWQARSKSLAARKESSESLLGKNRRSKAPVVSQNKVTRDVSVNGSRQVVLQTMASAPYLHHQASNGLVPAPVQPEIAGTPPQKVNVDINLSVVSPRPTLSQPSTSLPEQYTNFSQNNDFQFSSGRQVHQSATGHPVNFQQQFSGISQPVSAIPQPSAAQYVHGIAQSPLYRLPHPQTTPPFVASMFQQPLPHFVDARGQIIPNQTVPGEQVPVQYNYSYSYPLAIPSSDASQQFAHPYQMQVCFVKFSNIKAICV